MVGSAFSHHKPVPACNNIQSKRWVKYKWHHTHAGPILSHSHASWAAVETLVASLCVAALLVSWAHIPAALVDVCLQTSIKGLRFHKLTNCFHNLQFTASWCEIFDSVENIISEPQGPLT